MEEGKEGREGTEEGLRRAVHVFAVSVSLCVGEGRVVGAVTFSSGRLAGRFRSLTFGNSGSSVPSLDLGE